jgi:hypothetical protein
MDAPTVPSYPELEGLFAKWWAESYPHAPAGAHAIRTHAAFALYVLTYRPGEDLH